MEVEIWSDVVCPWCYIGKRNLEAALSELEHADEVEVVWRSFELDPGAPAVRDGAYDERLARKYRTSTGEARAMIARMVAAGAGAGLDLRFDISRPGNTFDAHRVIHLARARGLQGAVKERLLAAALTEGQPIGDRPTLARLAGEAGLDHDEVTEVLASGAFGDEVGADERRAAELDVSGVPFFRVAGRGIAGAQPPELLLRVLRRAWDAAHPVAGGVAKDA